MNNRNPLYDRAKGIGIILVIFGHLFRYGSAPSALIFSFHMPLFFIISGMLFKDGYKRLIKGYIIPFSFFTFIIGPCLYLISRTYTPGDFISDAKNILRDTFWYIASDVTYMGALWFVGILFASMLIVNIVNDLKKETKVKFFDIYVIGILFTFGSLAQYFHHNIPLRMKTLPMATMFVYFGLAYKDKILKFIERISIKHVLLISVIFSIALYFNGMVNIAVPVYNNPLFYFITSLLGTLLVLYVCKFSCTKYFEFFGRNSLVIFAMHGFWLILYERLLSLVMGGGEKCIMS